LQGGDNKRAILYQTEGRGELVNKPPLTLDFSLL
jgi:hypothetical protein